jgi:hypothetical protein
MKPTNRPANARICGSNSSRVAWRFTEARLQVRYVRSPITGHSATLSEGGGTARAPASIRSYRSETLPTADALICTVG